MISRRTRARIVFFVDILSLPLHVYQWRRAADENSTSIFTSRWLIAGLAYQTAYCWAYDHDLGAIRTKRWRRVLFSLFYTVLTLRIFPQSETVRRNFSTGESVGRIGYRLWYGMLRPLPSTED